MNKNELRLRDKKITPTSDILIQTLGDNYEAYETLQDELSRSDIEQVWQWYTPYKAWFARGQHWWTTSRGTTKEKNLFWLHVYDGYFCVTVWFKEKNRIDILNANVSLETKQLIRDAKTFDKLQTFPVVICIKNLKKLPDLYALINFKKRLETN